MTKEERSAARSAIAAASSLPWELKIGRTIAHVHNKGGSIGIPLPYKTTEEKFETELIVTACNAIPAALDALEKAEARLAEEERQYLTASYPGHYISTACQRGKHEHCRLNEKFSGEPCLCACGHPGAGDPPPTYDELKAALQQANDVIDHKDNVSRMVAANNQALRAEVERLTKALGRIGPDCRYQSEGRCSDAAVLVEFDWCDGCIVAAALSPAQPKPEASDPYQRVFGISGTKPEAKEKER
jgi:hypothetical protein